MKDRTQNRTVGLASLRVFMARAEANDPALARRNRRFAELVGREQAQARIQNPPPVEMSLYSTCRTKARA